jgi:hypothetical protein
VGSIRTKRRGLSGGKPGLNQFLCRVLGGMSCLALVAACSTGSPDLSAAPQAMPSTVSIPRIGIGPPSPIGLYDFFQPWPDSQALLAVQNLAIYCMRTKGWDVEPLSVADVPPEVLLRDDVNSGSDEARSQWGYGTVTVLADPSGFSDAYPSESSRSSFLDGLADSEQQAFNADYAGVQDGVLGGCMGWAQVGVAGPESLNPDFYDAIGRNWMRMRASSGYVDLAAEWGECMVRSGVEAELAIEPAATFEHFESVASETTRHDDLDLLARTEVSVAMADTRCRQQVDFSGRVRTLSIPFVDGLLADYPNALTQPFCSEFPALSDCVMCTTDDVGTVSSSSSRTACVRPEEQVPLPETDGPDLTIGQ